jgi:hypothetical protein
VYAAAAGMVESGSRPPTCAHVPRGRERRPMQPNGTERSKTRIFRYAVGRWLEVGCCGEATAANVTFSPYLSVRSGNPGSMWPHWPTGTERGKQARRLRGKAGTFRPRKCADRPKDVRGEAHHGRSDHHVGRQRHFRGQRRGRLVHAAQGSCAFRRGAGGSSRRSSAGRDASSRSPCHGAGNVGAGTNIPARGNGTDAPRGNTGPEAARTGDSG